MVLEFTHGKMGLNIKAIMLMGKNKEMVFFITLLGNNILECGQMGSKQVKEKLLQKMVKFKNKESGKMEPFRERMMKSL